MEFSLAWPDGAVEMEKFANGADDGWWDTLGNSVGIDVRAGGICGGVVGLSLGASVNCGVAAGGSAEDG